MKRLITVARKLTLYILMAVIVGGSPAAVFAEEATATPSDQDGGYVYDEATGRWNSNKWRYDSATNTYVPNVVPQQDAPADDSISQTGPDSTNQTNDTDHSSETNNTSNSATVNSGVNGQAKTGDAAVGSNTTGGDATSGNATSIATILNQLNSSSALSGNQPYQFTMDVNDVHGDIVLAPYLLQALGNTTAQSNQNTNTDSSLTYNVLDKNTLNNNVDLNAQSGNASVINNTNAGNAKTGDATAIANVLNIVNSVISANKSFIGTININGNLDGDILLNREGSPSLITSNAASNPLNSGNLIANQNNLTDIINNINLDATSGKASSTNNSSAGDATTGKADTNLVVMNVAGRTVNAKNSLLVFVNVLGKWVGIIVDAPTGATAAVLGDDITTNLIDTTGPGSNNAINSDTDSNPTINTDQQTKINNNLTVGAHSGDATVSGNTKAGSATSGNASASATVLNMANSAFNLSDWFGVLFINVLGTWDGSFGIDTDSGNDPVVQQPTASGSGASSSAQSVPAQVFSFIEKTVKNTSSSTGSVPQADVSENATTETTTTESLKPVDSVLSANDTKQASSDTKEPTILSTPAVAGILLGGALAVALTIRLIGYLRTR